jgi:hypothetical protein
MKLGKLQSYPHLKIKTSTTFEMNHKEIKRILLDVLPIHPVPAQRCKIEYLWVGKWSIVVVPVEDRDDNGQNPIRGRQGGWSCSIAFNCNWTEGLGVGH